MNILLVFVLLGLLARWVCVHRQLGRYELMQQSGSVWKGSELRRHALVSRSDDDLQEFPQPREIRLRALRVLGLPLWVQRCTVSLPTHVDARIDELRGDEFDHLFSARFRIDTAATFIASGWRFAGRYDTSSCSRSRRHRSSAL